MRRRQEKATNTPHETPLSGPREGPAGIAQGGILPSCPALCDGRTTVVRACVRKAAMARHFGACAGILAHAAPVACYEVHLQSADALHNKLKGRT